MNILEVKNLTKQFGTFRAVNNLSFELKQGEILGFLGPNGAGKTTTIQMLLSTMTPTSGSIKYFEKDFFYNREEILEKVSFASTYIKMPENLTVYQNLNIYARLYGMSKSERDESIYRYLVQFRMWENKDKPVGQLSAGQITRAMLAKAFLIKPKIVLLDEPTASLDPDISLEIRDFILEQREKNGVSILLTSHNMEEVAKTCDRVIVIQNGSIIANDTPANLACTVSKTKIEFLTCGDISRVINYLVEQNHRFTYNDNFLEIFIEENEIAALLKNLNSINFEFKTISINRPTLEDYFLQVIKNK